MKNKSNLIIFIIIIILAILLIWPAIKGPSDDVVTDSEDVMTEDSSDDAITEVDDKGSDDVMVEVKDTTTSSDVMVKPITTTPNGDVMVKLTPVTPSNSMTVNAYFTATVEGDTSTDCSVVYATPRTIARTQAPARAALMELFKGVTTMEASQGVSTAIGSGVKINSLMINNGIAKVDLSSELEANVAGSCRVTAIRSQIEKTLLQFPTVTGVLISVDGKTAGILQP